MIGFGASLVLPFEPIGFRSLLPILLGAWKGLYFLNSVEEKEEEGPENTKVSRMKKSILKVASVTVVNGGDNIGTYVPLISQEEGGEIAVYVVMYHILLGVWCVAAYLMMGQKHFLRLIQKYSHWLSPLLYVGLGVFIIIDSTCYPWFVGKIDKSVSSHPGKAIMGCVTTFLLLTCISAMLLFKLRKRRRQATAELENPNEESASSSTKAAHAEKEIQSSDLEVDNGRGAELLSNQSVDKTS